MTRAVGWAVAGFGAGLATSNLVVALMLSVLAAVLSVATLGAISAALIGGPVVILGWAGEWAALVLVAGGLFLVALVVVVLVRGAARFSVVRWR